MRIAEELRHRLLKISEMCLDRAECADCPLSLESTECALRGTPDSWILNEEEKDLFNA